MLECDVLHQQRWVALKTVSCGWDYSQYASGGGGCWPSSSSVVNHNKIKKKKKIFVIGNVKGWWDFLTKILKSLSKAWIYMKGMITSMTQKVKWWAATLKSSH